MTAKKLEIQQVQMKKEGKLASVNYKIPVSHLKDMPLSAYYLSKKYMQNLLSDARNLYSNV